MMKVGVENSEEEGSHGLDVQERFLEIESQLYLWARVISEAEKKHLRERPD